MGLAMHKYSLGMFDDGEGAATPDLSVLEAARLLDENHRAPILVRNNGLPVGVLTEDDVVAKVLAQGRDPNRVLVREVMEQGRVSRDGLAFDVEDDNATSPLHAALAMEGAEDEVDDVAGEVYAGYCEECGVDQAQVFDIDGFVLCEECLPLHSETRLA